VVWATISAAPLIRAPSGSLGNGIAPAMNLEKVPTGAKVVTTSGDVVEVLDVAPDGLSARVRYLDPLSSDPALLGKEASLTADEIAAIEHGKHLEGSSNP